MNRNLQSLSLFSWHLKIPTFLLLMLKRVLFFLLEHSNALKRLPHIQPVFHNSLLGAGNTKVNAEEEISFMPKGIPDPPESAQS